MSEENIGMIEETEIIETVEYIEVAEPKTKEVTLDEAFPAVGEPNDNRNHASLYNIDAEGSHPIKAITGLCEKLAEIERYKTVYSDKTNIANYYKWADGKEYDEHGYFVSIASGAEIKICEGTDIFGVTVGDAGFVGNQNQNSDPPRGKSYGLVVTSGLVDVRCEQEVKVGDYVTANGGGYAKVSDSKYGYKVLAKEIKDGVEYAVIMLGVQADVTNALGVELGAVEERVGINEQNIVSAINVANQAYKKSTEASESSSVSEEAVKTALESILKSEEKIKDFEDTLLSTNSVIEQAKTAAALAATSATSLKEEAITRANDAWAKADTVEKEAYSLCTKIDEHSVGEYSQAYGLTLEQAQSILKPGMIYVPTKHIDLGTHTEIYEYTNAPEQVVSWDASDKDANKVYYDTSAEQYWYYANQWQSSKEMPSYVRTFTPEYLYMWGYLPLMQKYGWITVDKDFNELEELNDSSKAVYFTTIEPSVSGNFGYWYTDGEDVANHEPYTLYKWESDRWVAVATLKGNASNRMVSEVYQTTNEIMMSVINPRGGIAGFNAKLTDTESTTQQLSMWKNGGETSKSIIRQHTENGNASIVIATVYENDDEVVEQASMVLSASKNDGSALVISADNIDFEADNYAIHASKIVLDGETTFTTEVDGKTKIHGASIATGTLSANQITTGILNGSNYEYESGTYAKSGMGIDLDNGVLRSKEFAIDGDGSAHFNGTFTVKNGNHTLFEAGGTTVNIGDFTVGRDEQKSYIYKDKTTYDSAETGVYLGTDGIGLGAGKFYVDNQGALCSESGKIAGWNITKTYLGASNDDGKIYILSPDGEFDDWIRTFDSKSKTTFRLKRDGSIKAISGTVGGWNLSDGEIYNNNDSGVGAGLRVYNPDAEGNSLPAFWAGANNSEASTAPFRVLHNGDVYVNQLITNDNDGKFEIKKDDSVMRFKVGKNISRIYCPSSPANIYFQSSDYDYVFDIGSDTSGTICHLMGTWKADSAITTSSDANLKYDILDCDDRYSLFFDSLKLKKFKYKDGASQRDHLGFIAQEVQEALQVADISEKEFAGLVTIGQGKDGEHMGLRYEEFIALNTHETQKLKVRVSELEAKNRDLEERLAKIEALLGTNN